MNPEKPQIRIEPSRTEFSGLIVEYAVIADNKFEGYVKRIPTVPSLAVWRGRRADGVDVPFGYGTAEKAARELVETGRRTARRVLEAGTFLGKIRQLRIDAGMVGNSQIAAMCAKALSGDSDAFAECKYIISENERDGR